MTRRWACKLITRLGVLQLTARRTAGKTDARVTSCFFSSPFSNSRVRSLRLLSITRVPGASPAQRDQGGKAENRGGGKVLRVNYCSILRVK